MTAKERHLATLWTVFDELRGHTSIVETLPLVLSLYGLRVLAASEGFYRQLGVNIGAARRWQQLKREGGDIGNTLNSALADISNELGVQVLNQPLSFVDQGADRLSRAILALDKLEARVGDRGECAVVGEVADVLLARFTDARARTGNEFTTPAPLNVLTTRLLLTDVEQDIQSVYDPACGVAGSLTSVHGQLNAQAQAKTHFYGQDVDYPTLFLAAWNLLLHGITKFTLEKGDTLTNPQFLEGDGVKRFDLVLANPPFYLVARNDLSKQDRYQRFRFGEVSGRRADFAFVQHALASLKPRGRAAVFMPLTALSRSFEEKIRANLVHADVLDACISLPTGTFPATSILAALLLFDQDKPPEKRERVFFINLADAVEKGRGREYPLADEDIERYVNIYKERVDTPGESGSATLEDIKANKYGLIPNRYVSKVQHELPDPRLLNEKIVQREAALLSARERFDKALGHFDTDGS
jgi:type I restriction enzyme M protein